MVLHKFGNKLHSGLKNAVLEHLQMVSQLIISAFDENFLQTLNNAWKDHKSAMQMIKDILMYMVCSPVIKSLPSPKSLSIASFPRDETRISD